MAGCNSMQSSSCSYASDRPSLEPAQAHGTHAQRTVGAGEQADVPGLSAPTLWSQDGCGSERRGCSSYHSSWPQRCDDGRQAHEHSDGVNSSVQERTSSGDEIDVGPPPPLISIAELKAKSQDSSVSLLPPSVPKTKLESSHLEAGVCPGPLSDQKKKRLPPEAEAGVDSCSDCAPEFAKNPSVQGDDDSPLDSDSNWEPTSSSEESTADADPDWELSPKSGAKARTVHRRTKAPRDRATDETVSASSSATACETFACEWDGCGAVFTDQTYLFRHVRQHVGEKSFCCTWDACSLSFSNHRDLIRHRRTHTGEKPFFCSWTDCTQSFAQKVSLARHQRMHTGEKSYACSWPGCSRRFADSTDRTRHFRTHTGDQPYVCDLDGCDRRFTLSHHLNRHRRKHLGSKEKPFRCVICKVSFAQAGGLAEHLRTDRCGDAQYKCSQCSKSFSFDSSWRRHVKRVHGKIATSRPIAHSRSR